MSFVTLQSMIEREREIINILSKSLALKGGWGCIYLSTKEDEKHTRELRRQNMCFSFSFQILFIQIPKY